MIEKFNTIKDIDSYVGSLLTYYLNLFMIIFVILAIAVIFKFREPIISFLKAVLHFIVDKINQITTFIFK